MCVRNLLTIAASLVFAHVSVANDKLPTEHAKFFEAEVRPLLVGQCLKCHGEKKQKGELRLDSRAAMIKGGESGAAIEPGEPDDSLLIEAIRHESFEMPPDKKLPDATVDAIARWIEMGAPWPQHGDKDEVLREAGRKITDEDRAWWAIQPLRRTEVPRSRNDRWSHNAIDHFIARKMAGEGLAPAAEADPETLIRRLSFDLIGLPPAPEEVNEFVNDKSPQAYEKLVDRLLASNAYGERWARHWLDLVRYADSDGYRIDHYRKEAWRYRDYVVAAFNKDKPYDRFVQEQLAGDELFPGNPEALIATSYLRNGIYEYNNRDVRGQWKAIMEDITDTTGDVFLGLGMRCAKCHDHKFDPILQKDYYRLQAFFAPIAWRDDLVAATQAEMTQHQQKLAQWEKKTAAIRQQIDEIEHEYRVKAARNATKKFPLDIQAMMNKPPSERTTFEHQLAELANRQIDFEYTRLDRTFKSEDKEKVLALRKELKKFDHLKPAPLPRPMTVTDCRVEPPQTTIPGEPDQSILPGYLTIFEEESAKVAAPAGDLPSTGRRSALARWVTRPDNPLSTRVIVNRVWQYHFGRGLAPNSSDLGRLGGAPTHPELLDWLATRFVQQGWSFKKLHREIVLSATYRQSTRHDQFAKFQEIDPQNRLYWRANTRRLDAEQIRDAMLAVSGQLQRDTIGGPGVQGDVPRRSIYLRTMRNARDPLLDAFDLPQFFDSQSMRNTTTTPVQSLLLINSQTMLRHASRSAQRISQEANNDQERIEHAWRVFFGRSPTERERELSLKFLREQPLQSQPDQSPAEASQLVTGKLPYRDGQALLFQPQGKQKRLLSPHHESLSAKRFTVEAYFQIRSVYESGAVRSIATKWTGSSREPGWAFGVTGQGSRRKPQTLVLHMHGKRRDGSFGEGAIFSDQHIELNTPYFAAVTIEPAGEKPGQVTFYLKDLSNDDEPLSIAKVPTEITGGMTNDEPLAIGGRSRSDSGHFDGLIDELRYSDRILKEQQLLFTAEGAPPGTVAYWQFEGDPGVFRDSSPNGRHLSSFEKDSDSGSSKQSPLVDFCHALLNSNEFLYVD